MINAKLSGDVTGLGLRLTNKKKGIFENAHESSVTCFVCVECGYIEFNINTEYGCEKRNGMLIAKIISEMPQHLKKQSMEREAGGAYKMVLREYLRLMEIASSNPIDDYNNIKGIFNILKSEKYLLLSDDLEIREIYCQLCKLGSEKYNRYMTYVR